jgi:hypothetical protein
MRPFVRDLKMAHKEVVPPPTSFFHCLVDIANQVCEPLLSVLLYRSALSAFVMLPAISMLVIYASRLLLLHVRKPKRTELPRQVKHPSTSSS